MEPSTALALGSSVIQGIRGLFGGSSAKGEMEDLLNQRAAYKTPDEVYDILAATQNNASSGLDPVTLSYLTGQTNQTFAAGLGTAERLGANPNDLGALFEQKINATMKIGSENHSANMARFSEYLSALGSVAENKTAEWKSQQDILKDKIQAKAGEIKSYRADVGNSINTAVGALAADETGNLYNPNSTTSKSTTATSKAPVNPAGSYYSTEQWNELGSILNYKGDPTWASRALPYNDR